MFTTIVAILLITFSTLMTLITIWSFTQLHKLGMLAGFMRGKILLSLLTTLFAVAFIVLGVALLREVSWAVPTTRYTLWLWLAYVLLYGLKKLLDLIFLLKFDPAKSVSQLMGRSEFFDQLLLKTIDMSRESNTTAETIGEGANPASDPEWARLVDDEDWFQSVFAYGVRKKIRRKIIGLLVQTVFVLLMIWML